MVLGSKYPVWEFYAKSRFRTSVDPAKCTGCRLCVDKRCQFGAAQMKFYPEYGEERAYVDEAKCMGCGCCVETCPAGARSMRIVEPPDPDTAATQAGPYFRT
jgi:heterodisulfide reductase subunit A-like polyferredoxin